MKNCKTCRHFYDAGKAYHCARQLTYCAPVKKPDLGTKLIGCKYERKEKDKDELQTSSDPHDGGAVLPEMRGDNE